MADQRRIMAVHAHPDDEASKGAATMAMYARQGRVRIVTATGGERGNILNPKLVNDPYVRENLAEVRRKEMAASVAALGVEHHWLGFVDSGLPEGDPLPPLPNGSFAAIGIEEPVRRLVAQIREFRPQVLTTYNEYGGYPHPDHIRVHTVSLAAVAASSDPWYAPELGSAWMVSKVYYDLGFSTQRLVALDTAMREAGLESPYTDWIANRESVVHLPLANNYHASINVAEYFPQRDAALRAHATQIDSDGVFFAVPREIEREVFPWEQFRLALSVVGPLNGIETDLFERIPGVE